MPQPQTRAHWHTAICKYFADLCGNASFTQHIESLVSDVIWFLSVTGNWHTWGWEICSSKWHRQPAQREGEVRVHPRCTQTHLQDPRRHGRQLPGAVRLTHHLPFSPWDPQCHYLSSFHSKRTVYNLFQQLAVFQHRQLQLHGEDLRPGAHLGRVSGAPGQSWAGNGSLCPRRGPVELHVHSGLGAALHVR